MTAPRRKLLFISSVVSASGAELILLDYLSRSDHDTITVAPKGDVSLELTSRGLPMIRSRTLGELHRRRNILWPIAFLVRLIAAAIELTVIILRNRPDLVVVNNFAAGIYSVAPLRVLRRPWMWFIYDIFPNESIEARTLARLATKSTTLIAASQAVERFVRSVAPRADVQVVYNGIETASRFNPRSYTRGSFRSRYEIPDDIPLITYLGQIAPHKGVHVLLDAVESFASSDVAVCIVGGSTPAHREYEESLRARNHSPLDGRAIVKFCGRSDPAPALRDTDILVVPSLFEDPLPTVVLEGMAMENVVVASQIGGIPEMIVNGVNGFLFPPGDVPTLAALLRDVVPDIGALDELRSRARATVEESFSFETKLRRLEQIYATVAG